MPNFILPIAERVKEEPLKKIQKDASNKNVIILPENDRVVEAQVGDNGIEYNNFVYNLIYSYDYIVPRI